MSKIQLTRMVIAGLLALSQGLAALDAAARGPGTFITINSPSSGSTVPGNGTIVFSGTAGHPGGVSAVALGLNGGQATLQANIQGLITTTPHGGQVMNSLPVASWTIGVPASLLPPGSNAIQAYVNGNAAMASVQLMIQDNLPPTISLLNPQNGALLAGMMATFSGNVSDNDPNTSLVLEAAIDNWVGGLGNPTPSGNWHPFDVLPPGATSWQYTIFFSGTLATGWHRVSVRARDASGNVSLLTPIGYGPIANSCVYRW